VTIAWAAVLLVVAACGGGGGDRDGGGDDAVDAAPGAFVGGIEIEEAELGTIGEVASIFAKYEARGEPDIANDGTCRVYEYPCLGQVGACQRPDAHSAGTITITGLASPVTLVPDPQTHFYSSPGGLPDDVFADTATVTADAPGDEVAGFSLSVMGVETLVSGYVDQPLGLVPGQPFDLTWTAGGSGAGIQLKVHWANICHAGAEWYVLVCEVTDSGTFTVPAAITGALPSPGFGQCGARLARFRRAAVPGGALDLFVASSDYFGLL
jgi:hypothetical protein